MLICKSCKDKFYIPNESTSLEGKMVRCSKCNSQWLYESKTKYLEDRLSDLIVDLDNTDNKINLRKKEREENVTSLENDLNLKKEELVKQKKLEEKINTFENRLKVTEKLNLEDLDLGKKAHKIQKEIRTTSANIEAKNKDIEEKANYLETKISLYDDDGENKINNEEKTIKYSNRNKLNDQDGDVVDIRTGSNQASTKNQDKLIDDKKDKKFKFFSPSSIK